MDDDLGQGSLYRCVEKVWTYLYTFIVWSHAHPRPYERGRRRDRPKKSKIGLVWAPLHPDLIFV